MSTKCVFVEGSWTQVMFIASGGGFIYSNRFDSVQLFTRSRSSFSTYDYFIMLLTQHSAVRVVKETFYSHDFSVKMLEVILIGFCGCIYLKMILLSNISIDF